MFKVFDANVADTEVHTYLPGKDSETITYGEALTISDQGLTKCAATDRPQYICRGPKNENGLIPFPLSWKARDMRCHTPRSRQWGRK